MKGPFPTAFVVLRICHIPRSNSVDLDLASVEKEVAAVLATQTSWFTEPKACQWSFQPGRVQTTAVPSDPHALEPLITSRSATGGSSAPNTRSRDQRSRKRRRSDAEEAPKTDREEEPMTASTTFEDLQVAVGETCSSPRDRLRCSNSVTEAKETVPSAVKSQPKCQPKVVAKKYSQIMAEMGEEEEDDDIIDIVGDYSDEFSDLEVMEDLSLEDPVSDMDMSESRSTSYHRRGRLRNDVSDEDEEPAEDIDVLFFGEDSLDDYEDLRPKKRARLTPSTTPLDSPAKQHRASPYTNRRASSSSRLLYDAEDLEMVESGKKKRRKSHVKSASNSKSPEREAPPPPPHVPLCLRRFVPIVEQYDEGAGALISIEEFEPYSHGEEVEADDELEHPSDDEFNDDPILIEIVPEWQWPGVENHPFFLNDKPQVKPVVEVKPDPLAEIKEEPQSEPSSSSSSSADSDGEIDILGGSASEDDVPPMPILLPGKKKAQRKQIQGEIKTSEEEVPYGPDEQPSLASVKDRNLHIPTWRLVADEDSKRNLSLEQESSSDDEELPDAAYAKMHRRKEVIEKMELKEFMKLRKKKHKTLQS